VAQGSGCKTARTGLAKLVGGYVPLCSRMRQAEKNTFFRGYQVNKSFVKENLMENINKTKTIVLIIVSVLALIIILQNIRPVETYILFFKVTMPRAFLLIVTLLLGFIGGAISVLFISKKKEMKEKKID
jgi:uncharacterized integral membrane protein